MSAGRVEDRLPDDLEGVRRALLDWYAAEHRAFPWRDTDDPYAILVCEVMSQQTQLDRIAEPWAAFLDRWPTVEALAAADRADVVGFWSAHRLGYNNRARYLHEAATMLVEEFDGTFPETADGLQALPGVGPYTATAVASFAFGEATAVVDTNVKRVLHRAFDVPDDDGAFESVAEALLPDDAPRAWNEAMMELGGTVCSTTPRCDAAPCPWRDQCGAYATGDFSAPDVPTQAPFDGSRRQFRGRVVRALEANGELTLAALGPRVRVDYAPDGDHGRGWLRELLADLADDGLVEVEERDGETVARLAR
ncbi:MAG: A/G-specific adenine glycosylase [Halobacteriales archaeon]